MQRASACSAPPCDTCTRPRQQRRSCRPARIVCTVYSLVQPSVVTTVEQANSYHPSPLQLMASQVQYGMGAVPMMQSSPLRFTGGPDSCSGAVAPAPPNMQQQYGQPVRTTAGIRCADAATAVLPTTAAVCREQQPQLPVYHNQPNTQQQPQQQPPPYTQPESDQPYRQQQQPPCEEAVKPTQHEQTATQRDYGERERRHTTRVGSAAGDSSQAREGE